MNEYDIGDTFEAKGGDEHWQIQGASIEYEVVRRRPGTDGEEGELERMHMPQGTLKSKEEYNDITLLSGQPEEEEDSQTVDCEECGETFESKQGMRSHYTQVHEDSDESDEE